MLFEVQKSVKIALETKLLKLTKRWSEVMLTDEELEELFNEFFERWDTPPRQEVIYGSDDSR